MRPLIVLLGLAVLTACGADGDPFRPTGNVGVSIGPNGVNTNASVGATNGIISVGIGL